MGDESDHSSAFGNSATQEITGRIALMTLSFLFIAVLFVLLLHLYAKLFLWRVEHQPQQPDGPGSTTTRRHRGRFFFPAGQDPIHTVGLDPSVLQSIPLVVFRPHDFKDGLECAVCLSELVEGEKARLLPKCNHGFHVDCIDMWFQAHPTCPLCRNTVGSSSVGSVSEEEPGFDPGTTQNPESANSHHYMSQNPNLNSGYSMETPNFPTNVLIWGDQNQVSSAGARSVEDNVNASSSDNHQSAAITSSGNRTQEETTMVINIPEDVNVNLFSSSSTRFVEEDPKCPVTTRLRALTRLLSRDKRAVINTSGSSTSSDV